MQVDIVIPNYNGKEFLRVCLPSIQKQTFIKFKVIVVDNGSKDGSVEFLHREYPQVEVVSWHENKGFSEAVNAGIDAGTAPFVFLLNNDTELDKFCLEKLISAAVNHPESDFFATKMLNYHNRRLLDGAGDAFLRGGVGYRLGTMELDSYLYNDSRHVFGACAGAALYRRNFLEEVGTFDEDFFAYLEDVDLNLRAKSRGKMCWYVAEANVFHIGSATTGSKINELTVRLTTKNNLNILLKNYPLSLLFRFAPAIIVYQFFWFCFVIKKRQFLAYCKGVLAFMKNCPTMLQKRRKNLSLINIQSSDLASLICTAEKEVIQSIMNRRKEKGQGNFLFSLYIRIFL